MNSSTLATTGLSIPILETSRLRLRAHEVRDFEHMARMWADEKVVQHIGGKPSSEQQSWARLLSYHGHWSLMGFGYWAVEDKYSGSYIGEIGFADFRREMNPSILGLPEAGWAFRSEVHGKGYATEALTESLKWVELNLKAEKTVCIINPENLASIRVAEKCGFKLEQDTFYAGRPTSLFARIHLGENSS
jgi:RimJ/RimL family protein N-acetyltransferase